MKNIKYLLMCAAIPTSLAFVGGDKANAADVDATNTSENTTAVSNEVATTNTSENTTAVCNKAATNMTTFPPARRYSAAHLPLPKFQSPIRGWAEEIHNAAALGLKTGLFPANLIP